MKCNSQFAYIKKMNWYLAFLEEELKHFPIRSSDLTKTIRSSTFWGTYPWRDLDFAKTSTSFLDRVLFLTQLPLHLISSLFHLAVKYFQYLNYRFLKMSVDANRRIGFFSPTAYLDEFRLRRIRGFWGEVKFLDERTRLESVWFLIPNKSPKISHRQFALELKDTFRSSNLCIIPLASLFTLNLVVVIACNLIAYHFFIWFICLRQLFKGDCHKLFWIYDPANSGKEIAATEINRSLLEACLQGTSQLESVVHLMEGHSWEISLIQAATEKGLDCTGLIHTPIRYRDTQILNYFLRYGENCLAQSLNRILCPGLETYKYMQHLDVKKSKLGIVEAQRFIPFKNIGHHIYRKNSRSILYVSDASAKSTSNFLNLVKELNVLEQSDFRFHIQLHTSLSYLDIGQIKRWNSQEFGVWGLVIFGPETSSYAQSEFSGSNIRIFDLSEKSLDLNDSGFTHSQIPKIHSLCSLESEIASPFILGNGLDSLLNIDSNFPAWRKELNELYSK